MESNQEEYNEQEDNLERLYSNQITVHGMICFMLLSIRYLDPTVSSIIFSGMGEPRGVLLINTIISVAWYLSCTKFMEILKPKAQLIFCCTAGTLFCFAPIYGWYLCSLIFPKIPFVNTIIGLFTAYGYMKLCKNYIAAMERIMNIAIIDSFGDFPYHFN